MDFITRAVLWILAGIMLMGCLLMTWVQLSLTQIQYERSQVSAHLRQGRNVHGHWLLDGSDPDASYFGSVSFTRGRCSDSKAADFVAKRSYATVPSINITDCDFTIAFWMKLPSRDTQIRIRNIVIFWSVSTEGNTLFLSLSKKLGQFHFVFGQTFLSKNVTSVNVAIGQVRFDEWTHLAASCQEGAISLFVNGELQSISRDRNNSFLPFRPHYFSDISRGKYKSYYIGDYPLKHRIINIVKFWGSVMDLHVTGLAFTEDEIKDLFNDFPLIIQVELNETTRNTVKVTWETPACPVDIKMYFIYYRKVIRTGNDGNRWNKVNVSSSETQYDLQLESFTEYEIAVTVSANKVLPSTLWRVRTEGVNNTIPLNTNHSGNNDRRIKAVLIIGSILAVVIVTVGVICLRKKRKKRQRHAVLEKRSKLDIVRLLQREVPPERVTLLEELGRGAFGKVHRGVLRELPNVEVFYKPKEERVDVQEENVVAVKVLLETTGEEGKKQLLQEIEFMKQIGSHRNVLSMLGFWVKSEPIMLILEYVPHGDLLQWLRNKRQFISSHQCALQEEKPLTADKKNKGATGMVSKIFQGVSRAVSLRRDDGVPVSLQTEKTKDTPRQNRIRCELHDIEVNIITVQSQYEQHEDSDEDFSAEDLLCFAWQIAHGMEYLASRGFVHRDLAARNVLLGEDKAVKISDFGLLRHTYGEIYEVKTMKKLPIKWTAPEALYYSRYTSKSDVWSFGVLLWELATMGGVPYPGISNKELSKLLKTGYRMDKPDMCSDEIYKLMLDCWKEDPNQRPTFSDLITKLEEMMTRDTPYYDFDKLDENDACYEEVISDSSDTCDPDTHL